jgi:hypothetical protein
VLLGQGAGDGVCDQVVDRHTVRGHSEDAGLDAGEFEEVADHFAHAFDLGADAGVLDARIVHQVSSSASVMACRPASGVRRSWEIQATSSRWEASRALSRSREARVWRWWWPTGSWVRQRDQWQRAGGRTDAAAHLQPARARQHQVQHHQVGRLRGGPGHGGGTVTGHIDGEARPVQVSGHDLGRGRVVVHHEYASHANESVTGGRQQQAGRWPSREDVIVP